MTKQMLLLRDKKRTYLGALFILAAVVLCIKSKPHNPEVRQPLNVVGVQPLSKPFELKKNMLGAKKSAERLDNEAERLMQASYMGYFERWSKNIDLPSLNKQYSRDLLSHLNAMTALMKNRREVGGFQKLREFEFQNMIRKSDYLLALPVAKVSIKSIDQDRRLTESWQKTLAEYNRERMIFDSKKIIIAEN